MEYDLPLKSTCFFFQVGTYFVGQYYQVLQQQPDFVHQFYSDASTMLRIDGNTRETATGMLVLFVVLSVYYFHLFTKSEK